MTFVIDGYNLMYAVGYAAPRMARKTFERKRGEFLDWLARELAGRDARLWVVFDAQQAVGRSPDAVHKGVRVRFAYRETADDAIERLFAEELNPAAMTAVSNDARVRAAATHRGSPAMTCEAFTDWLTDRRPVPTPVGPALPEKPDGPTPPDEVEELLKAFSVRRGG